MRSHRQKPPKPPASKAIASSASTSQPTQLNAVQAIDLALQKYRAGQNTQSLQLCLRILPNQPRHFTLLYLTATNYHLLGDATNALKYLQRAAEQRPHQANILSDIADNLRLLGHYQESLAYCQRALALQPNDADVLSNQGNALYMLERFNDALHSYNLALQTNPNHVNSLSNRGSALLELKQPEAALASFQQALSLQPDHLSCINNMGNALFLLNRHHEAEAYYQRVLVTQPNHIDALYNRGCVLAELQHYDDALTCFERLLQQQPHSEKALFGRGNALKQLKRYPEAIACWQQLLDRAPDYPYLRGSLFSLRQSCCDWTDYTHQEHAMIQAVLAGKKASTPFGFLTATANPAAQLQCARQYVAHENPPRLPAVWQGEIYAHTRIKVAYLSADYYNHATAYLMVELLARHNRQHFEIIGISFGPDPQDIMRQRLEGLFDTFIDVRERSDRDIALLLRELEIDIAIDLKGFTQDSRMNILAYRPAPIQINYLGYPGTLGADYIDYIIADHHLIPNNKIQFYKEHVVRLPDCYQVNDRQRLVAPDTPTRANVGLPEQGFVFCSFNNHYKITPTIFAIWMRLLQQVPDSILWQLCDDPMAMANLRKEAQQHGIDPARLVFAERMSSPKHLARQRLADLFLDTQYYNAHTTASDALWMGLPLLTCQTDAFAGRVAASLLYAVGLPELVTHNLANYEALALKLATTPALLATTKAKLLAQRDTCALFDTDRYCHHLEVAYLTLWQRYQNGEAPTAFDVPLRA